MQFFQDVLTHTAISTSLWDAYDLIGFGGAKITTNDAPVLGVAKHPNTVIGDPGAVMVSGIARVRARGAITAGAKVTSAAAGGVKAFVSASETNACGVALSAAADGEFVTVRFI